MLEIKSLMDQLYNMVDEKKQDSRRVEKKFLASLSCLEKTLTKSKWVIIQFFILWQTYWQLKSRIRIRWGSMSTLFMFLFFVLFSILVFLCPASPLLTTLRLTSVSSALASVWSRARSWSISASPIARVYNSMRIYCFWMYIPSQNVPFCRKYSSLC